MTTLSHAASSELEELQRKHVNVSPRLVLDFARDKNTELHRHFEWSDDIAAERYRLYQAAGLIRLYVVIRGEGEQPVRGLVSIIQDRKSCAGIYRHIDDVMSDTKLRANLLETALMELRALRRKYEGLRDLAAVWESIDVTETKLRQTPQKESRASA